MHTIIQLDSRKENGHGSSQFNPTFVQSSSESTIKHIYPTGDDLTVGNDVIAYFNEALSIDSNVIIDGILKEINEIK